MIDDNSIYLSLGSNLPPRKTTIRKCLARIRQSFPDRFSVSSVYLTAPYLGNQQPFYLNCCAGFKADLQPDRLLQFCAGLEQELGRIRDGLRWQSRTIDIDILLIGNRKIQSVELTIPHYDLENRDFVLIPLLELNPNLIDPVSGELLLELLERIPRRTRTFPMRLYRPD